MQWERRSVAECEGSVNDRTPQRSPDVEDSHAGRRLTLLELDAEKLAALLEPAFLVIYSSQIFSVTVMKILLTVSGTYDQYVLP